MNLNPWLAGVVSLFVALLVPATAFFMRATIDGQAADPEGAAYLIFFVGLAIPGLGLSLLLADQVARLAERLGKAKTIISGISVALITSCAIYIVACLMLIGSAPIVALVIPAGLALISSTVFLALRRSPAHFLVSPDR